MLWYWLEWLGNLAVWCFVYPTEKEKFRLGKKIDTSLKCPGCGATGKHDVRCVEMPGARAGETKVQIRHKCAVCRGKFYEKPIADKVDGFLFHAVPETEVEKTEDANYSRGFEIAVKTGQVTN